MRRIVFASIVIAAVAALAPRAGGPASAASTVGCSGSSASACVGLLPPVQPVGPATCYPSRPHASGTTVQTVSTTSGIRSYRLHVPPSYNGASPLPLVLSIHGANSSAFAQEGYSGFSTKADAAGFIVVYPDGLTGPFVTYTHWNAFQFGPPEPDDVGFINAMLDAVELQLCVDQTRVFSTGISNGAMMSTRLACSVSSRIAAIAPVAGAYYPPVGTNLNQAETCPDTTAVPLLAFHGTNDTYVPFNGGTGTSGPSGINYRLPIDDNTPAEDVLSDWATHNGCMGARQESQIDTEVRLISYGSCTNGAVVQLYIIDGGGHTWPGAPNVASLGYTTHQINATDLIWAFFSTHPPLLDADGDGVPDNTDNCPLDANAGQQVTRPNFINLHGFGKLFDDTTYLNATTTGDACTPEIDGDGFPNGTETQLGPGGADHNLCPAATANTDPLKLDTDGDGFTDRAECLLGADPASATSMPPATYATGDADHDGIPDALEATLGTDPGNPDSDGDKLNDGVEFLYYNSNPLSTNTDGDLCNDGKEAASVNDDMKVNSGDQLAVARAFSTAGGPLYVPDFDLNRDGKINSSDQLIQAKVYGPC